MYKLFCSVFIAACFNALSFSQCVETGNYTAGTETDFTIQSTGGVLEFVSASDDNSYLDFLSSIEGCAAASLTVLNTINNEVVTINFNAIDNTTSYSGGLIKAGNATLQCCDAEPPADVPEGWSADTESCCVTIKIAGNLCYYSACEITGYFSTGFGVTLIIAGENVPVAPAYNGTTSEQILADLAMLKGTCCSSAGDAEELADVLVCLDNIKQASTNISNNLDILVNKPDKFNKDCGLTRTIKVIYDNGVSPGSSSNDCGKRPDFVTKNQSYVVLGIDINGSSYGSGYSIPAFPGSGGAPWTQQINAWAAFINTVDPNASHTATNAFLPAPIWRHVEIEGCEPDATYGDLIMQGEDGCVYTIKPTVVKTEKIKIEYYNECALDGTVLTLYCVNGAAPTQEEPDNLPCLVSCDYSFNPVVSGDVCAQSETGIYCGRDGETEIDIIRVVNKCGIPYSIISYTLDSYNGAESVADLVEYTGIVYYCGTDNVVPEPVPDCVPSAMQQCVLFEENIIDVWYTSCGNWVDCEQNVIANFQKLDCECVYTKLETQICITTDASCTTYYKKKEELSLCDDVFASTGAQIKETYTTLTGAIVSTIPEGEQVPCNGCEDLCQEVCWICENAKPTINPAAVSIKKELVAVAIKLQAVKSLRAKKQLIVKEKSLRKKLAAISSAFLCKAGETLHTKICEGVAYDISSGLEVSTLGFARSETCDFDVCSPPITIKGEVSIIDTCKQFTANGCYNGLDVFLEYERCDNPAYDSEACNQREVIFEAADFEGTVGISNMMPGWEQLQFGDGKTNASSQTQATSDVVSSTGPNATSGIIGTSACGQTHVQSLIGGQTTTNFGEGLQKNVTGLVAGTEYCIDFSQAKSNQTNGCFETGGWQFCLDSDLSTAQQLPECVDAAQETDPTNVNLNWEAQTVCFTATASTHTIQFIPYTTDADYACNSWLGRMAIDCIEMYSNGAGAGDCSKLKTKCLSYWSNGSFIDIPETDWSAVTLQSCAANQVCNSYGYDNTALCVEVEDNSFIAFFTTEVVFDCLTDKVKETNFYYTDLNGNTFSTTNVNASNQCDAFTQGKVCAEGVTYDFIVQNNITTYYLNGFETSEPDNFVQGECPSLENTLVDCGFCCSASVAERILIGTAFEYGSFSGTTYNQFVTSIESAGGSVALTADYNDQGMQIGDKAILKICSPSGLNTLQYFFNKNQVVVNLGCEKQWANLTYAKPEIVPYSSDRSWCTDIDGVKTHLVTVDYTNNTFKYFNASNGNEIFNPTNLTKCSCE